MGCCGQTTTIGAGVTALDTNKRVNYTKGMLLGVDDFVQEQAWHIARRHELARELIGYGTARGLKVEARNSGNTVAVSPGIGWTPSGTPVCVSDEQCADVTAWLRKQDATFKAGLGSGTSNLTVHVVLAYQGVPTDKVPVPGEPCRSEDALTANSRIADCFQLTRRTQAPPQLEEDAIRDFADWLAQVPVDLSSPPMSDEDFLQSLRDAAEGWLTPTSPPPTDYMLGSPPMGLNSTDGLLRVALRLWVTELRPIWRARYGCGPRSIAPGADDDAFLLATLTLSVDGTALTGAVTDIDESRRPLLLSLRMLQELILQNPAPEAAETVTPALSFGLEPEVGVLSEYARADHSHGTPTLPDLAGDVIGDITANTVVALRNRAIATTAPQVGDVLALDNTQQWSPTHLPVASDQLPAALAFGGAGAPGANADYARRDHVHPLPALPELAGDTQGPIATNKVRALQGTPVADTAPTLGQVLMFQEVAAPGPGPASRPRRVWVPANLPTPETPELPPLGGDVSGDAKDNRIDLLQGNKVAAAGVAQVLISSGQFKAGSAGGAPKVEVRGGNADGRVARISLVVRDIPRDEHPNHRITVLLTPIVEDPKRAILAYVGKAPIAEGADIHFDIMILGLEAPADAQVVAATGSGIAWGLEVNAAGPASDAESLGVVTVEAGLAVALSGQALRLNQRVSLSLIQPPADTSGTSGGALQSTFGPCVDATASTYVAGDGLLLLTLSPIDVPEGFAPVLALEAVNTRCARDVIAEGVQLKLLPIPGGTISGTTSAALAQLRNRIAHECLGSSLLRQAHRQPTTTTPRATSAGAHGHSLLDRMLAERSLSACDVPLALVCLIGRQIAFIDGAPARVPPLAASDAPGVLQRALTEDAIDLTAPAASGRVRVHEIEGSGGHLLFGRASRNVQHT